MCAISNKETIRAGQHLQACPEVAEKAHRMQACFPKTAETTRRALELDCTGLGWTAKEEPGGQGAKQLLDLPTVS